MAFEGFSMTVSAESAVVKFTLFSGWIAFIFESPHLMITFKLANEAGH